MRIGEIGVVFTEAQRTLFGISNLGAIVSGASVTLLKEGHTSSIDLGR